MILLILILCLQDDRPGEEDLKRLDKLIERLNDDDPAERQKASDEIVGLGPRYRAAVHDRIPRADSTDVAARLKSIEMELDRLDRVRKIEALLPKSLRKGLAKELEQLASDDPAKIEPVVARLSQSLQDVMKGEHLAASQSLRAILDLYRDRGADWKQVKLSLLDSVRWFNRKSWTDVDLRPLGAGIVGYFAVDDDGIREAAVNVIERLDWNEAAPKLLDLFQGKAGHHVRDLAGVLLSQLQTPDLDEAIAELIASSDKDTSEGAIEIAVAHGYKDAARKIAKFLEDPARRATAVRAIGMLGATEYSKEILEIFAKDDGIEVVQAVGRLRLKEAAPKLKAKSSTKEVLIALSLIGETDHLDALAKYCEDAKTPLRDKVEVLMSLNGRNHFELLQKLWQVRVGTSCSPESCFAQMKRLAGATQVEGEKVPSVAVSTSENQTLWRAIVLCATTVSFDYTVVLEGKRVILMKWKDALEYWRKRK